jgi:uncharacterized protein YegP (UPF0339 family)
MKGILLPVKERHSQITQHGFDAKHDNDKFHRKGEMVQVALFFLTGDKKFYPSTWKPWLKENYKKKTKVQQIVIAIALLMAEVDRRTKSVLALPDLELRRAKYEDGPDQYYYVIRARNGGVLATSETYTRRSSARRACNRLNKSIGAYLKITDATETYSKLSK